MKETQRGKELYEKLDRREETYTIREYDKAIDQADMYYKDLTIVVNPNPLDCIIVKGGRRVLPSVERQLAHEMGYAATGFGDAPRHPLERVGPNIDKNENAVAKQLSPPEPERSVPGGYACK